MYAFLYKHLINPEIAGIQDLLLTFVVDLFLSAVLAWLLSLAIYKIIFRNSVINEELHSRWGAIRAVHLSWLIGYLVTGCLACILIFCLAKIGIAGSNLWRKILQIAPLLIVSLIWLISVYDQYLMLTRFHKKR